jgi:hypothetical protein
MREAGGEGEVEDLERRAVDVNEQRGDWKRRDAGKGEIWGLCHCPRIQPNRLFRIMQMGCLRFPGGLGWVPEGSCGFLKAKGFYKVLHKET